MNWRSVKHDKVIRIERVVAEFEVWVNDELPFAKFRVKVREKDPGRFFAAPNVAIRNPVTGAPEWGGGLGESVDEALADALKYFFREIEQHKPDRPMELDDFAWSHPDDF